MKMLGIINFKRRSPNFIADTMSPRNQPFFAENSASDLISFIGNEANCSANQMVRKPMNVSKIHYIKYELIINMQHFKMSAFIMETS